MDAAASGGRRVARIGLGRASTDAAAARCDRATCPPAVNRGDCGADRAALRTDPRPFTDWLRVAIAA